MCNLEDGPRYGIRTHLPIKGLVLQTSVPHTCTALGKGTVGILTLLQATVLRLANYTTYWAALLAMVGVGEVRDHLYVRL